MRRIPPTTAKAAFSALLLLLATACATTLAPDYDKAIVDRLVAVSEKMMEHFASTTSGTTAATFAKREKTYNEIIGSLDALAIQARARPLPNNKVTQKINEYLRSRGMEVLDGEGAPSAIALEQISKTLAKMRDTDRKQGVTAVEISAFKGQAVIFLDQALTYESFLER